MKSSKHRLLYIPIALLFLLSFVDCAKKGRPTGGKKDSIPPIIVKSSPENYTINFSEKEIRIYFDEYIKLKDLQTNLLISPPLEYLPVITPLSTSKILKIKILDTLKENTTYSINFGRSIVDNNEENPYDYYKYVFSTGSYIDSLRLGGTVKDIKLLNSQERITVMLYEVNEAFNDSVIFREKPTYITTTPDSTNTFELTNLKAGKYLMLALKEANNDYTYQPATDKIGFLQEYITLPTDSSYALTLFKQTPAYKISKPKHEAKQRIIFGYEGEGSNLELQLLSNVPEAYTSKVYKDFEKDTLHYYFKPNIEADSLVFRVKNKDQLDTVTSRMRKLFLDSLTITAVNARTLKPRDTFTLRANVPLVALDAEKITVMDQDTVAVSTTTRINESNNTVSISFPTIEDQNYQVTILPEAFTSFFDQKNDTLTYRLGTKVASDYGEITMVLENANEFPLLAELVDTKFKVIDSNYLLTAGEIVFKSIDPGSYYIRIIYDSNKNGKWDSGDYLSKTQPETIRYYPSKIEVLSNWSLNEKFILE